MSIINTTVSITGLVEFREALLALPSTYRKKIVNYSLRKGAGLLRGAVIQILVSMGLVDTGNLKRSIIIAPGRVRNRQFQAALLVGIKRIGKAARQFRKAYLKVAGTSKTEALRQLKKAGAISAFYGAALERGYMLKLRNGKVMMVPGFHFFAKAMAKVEDAVQRVIVEALKEKLPIVLDEFKRRMATARRRAA